MITPKPLDWQDDAACSRADVDLTLFFAPEDEYDGDRLWREAQAKAICAACPARRPCLDYRLSFDSQLDGGIWAGLDEAERKRLRDNRLRRQPRRSEAA